jgi:methylenetetrahydrofolate dehydrogenase (NADP+)/methenyltetrahydrofolate cyclohydrolase
MATILKGAPVVAAMNEANAARCAALAAKGITPTLAVVRVGEREDDLSYERGVMTRCGKVGVAVRQFLLPADAAQDALLEVIEKINADKSIHGCLLFRPLPRQFDDRTIRAALAPEKDIDGITDGSLAGVFTNTALGYPPCTAQACLEILKYYDIPLSGKRAVVVGRSMVVGRPLSMLFLKENATVTVCHTKTADLKAVCRDADILVAAAGKAGMISGEFVKPGAVVADVGINVDENGALKGDVEWGGLEAAAAAATPVPGGVGSVTTAVLCRHLAEAALRKYGAEQAQN